MLTVKKCVANHLKSSKSLVFTLNLSEQILSIAEKGVMDTEETLCSSRF